MSDDETTNDPLLKVADVAWVLNISPSCVRELARRGNLAGIKIISDWRFQRKEIEKFIDRHKYHGHQAHKERLAG